MEIDGNVIYDEEEKIFKMWYLGEGGDHFPFGYPTLYTTSTDGIEWEKPKIGTLRAVKGDPFKHNAVGQGHLAGVMNDRGDTHPDRRYNMITFVDSPRKRRGYHTLVSPDGLN